MIRRILWGLGGLGWTGTTFLAGVYFTFPGEAVRDWAEWQVAHSTKDEYALEMSPVRLWWFPGAAADDVKLYTVKKAKKKADPDAPLERTQVAELDSFGLRYQLLPRLLGKKSFGYTAVLNDGAVDGSYADSDAATELDFSGDGIDLSRSPVDNDTVTLNLLGKVDMHCDLKVDKEDVKNSTGSLTIDIPGFGLADGSKVVGLALQPVEFTKASVAFEAKDGKLEVTDGTFSSSTINATLTGDIGLNKVLSKSRYRLELAFTLPEELDKMAALAPDLKRSRDKDGNYHVTISGSLLAPKFRVGKGLGSRLGGGGVGLGRDDASGGDDASSDDDREARRAAREERIRERRERMRQRRMEQSGRVPMDDVGGPDDVMPRDRGDDVTPPDDQGGVDNPAPAQPDMPDIGPPPDEPFTPPQQGPPDQGD